MNTITDPRPDKLTRIDNKPKVIKPSQQELEKFVGEIPNLHKIDCINVYGSKYRINVWTKNKKEGQITPVFSLVKSYFVSYNDLQIIDETL